MILLRLKHNCNYSGRCLMGSLWGQTISDPSDQMILISEWDSTYIRFDKGNLGLVNLDKFDSINRLIPLSIILSRGLHCTKLFSWSEVLQFVKSSQTTKLIHPPNPFCLKQVNSDLIPSSYRILVWSSIKSCFCYKLKIYQSKFRTNKIVFFFTGFMITLA